MDLRKPKRHEDRALLDEIKSRPCIICGTNASDPCHIKTVKNGGPDTEWNVVPMCRTHHAQQHRDGIKTFMEKHPVYMNKLRSLGWEQMPIKGLWHPKLNKG